MTLLLVSGLTKKAPEMSSSVPNKWLYDIILSHKSTKLSDYLLHQSNGHYEHEQIDNIDRGMDIKTRNVT